MNDFKKEYQDIKSQIDSAITNICESGWYILGSATKQFESEFASYIGVQSAIGVANGLEAIQIALLALNIGPGDEVLTVSNSAVATTLAITAVGATPVFVDIDEYYHMDPQQCERLITPRTKALLPVHLFGQCVNIKALQEVAHRHNLTIIEDACQAHGASYEGKMAGSLGTVGCFSFYPTKNLGGYGDGGAITAQEATLTRTCNMLRNYGQLNRYEHKILGLNSRLDELQSSILSVKLKKLPWFIEKRRELAEYYKSSLAHVLQIKLPLERPEAKHAYHLFVIEAENRDALKTYLFDHGVESLVHYPIPIHKQECYKEFNAISLPQTERMAKRILSLPIHPYLSTQDIDHVVQLISQFYKI